MVTLKPPDQRGYCRAVISAVLAVSSLQNIPVERRGGGTAAEYCSVTTAITAVKT